MGKEEIGYSIVGIALGLVLGFLIGNWTTPAPVEGNQQAAAGDASTSVNAPREQELPPGHPPVTPGQTTPAPPLPTDSGAASTAQPPSSIASGETSALPSLDPLPASSREERAEKKYKNIQILRGLPADRIESIMFGFKNSLGVECTYCHVKDQFDKDDRPAKQMARKMITITRDANAKLGGAARVTCFTCHRGQPRPPG